MTDLERFLTDFMAKDHDSLAMDKDKWITIHPNGTDNRAVMIDDKTGVIKKGLAIGLIGTKLKDIRDNFKDKAKIEQHKARAEGEKSPEVKETKEPEKKEYGEVKTTIEQYLTNEGYKVWNKRRIYMKEEAKKWLNVKDDYYKTGNLRSFEWEDGLESNSYGKKVLSAIENSYFDVNSQTFEAEGTDPSVNRKVIDKLNEKAKEMGLVVREKPFKSPWDNPVYQDNKELLGRLVNKDLGHTVEDILQMNKFKDIADFTGYIKENYPYMYDTMKDIKENIRIEKYFKGQSAAGKFWGENGMDKVTNKYFTINHKPDANTCIIEAPLNRMRVVGSNQSLVMLLDKNRGVYVDKNSLPIARYDKDSGEEIVSMAVKLQPGTNKVYTFTNGFEGAENLKPIKGFNDIQTIAEEQEKQGNTYKNVSDKELPGYIDTFKKGVKEHQEKFRKPVETVKTSGTAGEIENFISQGWNGKVYRYRNGDNAIFVNNQKILLTKEQLDYIDSKDKK